MIQTEALTSTCEICDQVLIINLSWEPSSPGSPAPDEFRKEAIGHARNDHWRQFHRNCAVCGKRLGHETGWTVYTGRFAVHQNYVQINAHGEYFRIDRTTAPGSRLVAVHPDCDPESASE